MVIDVIEQLVVSVVGGFILNIIWDQYIRHKKKNDTPHFYCLYILKEFFSYLRESHPIVAKCITFFVCFSLIYLSTEIYRSFKNYNKDWINFRWIICEDDKIGNVYLSLNYDIYAQRGEDDRELVVRQVHDTTLVQVYVTDFDIEKPNVFFSDNNRYGLVTENKNVNLFNNITGELICSFKIKGEEVNSVLILEEEQKFFLVTTVGEYDYSIGKYDMTTGKCLEEKIWEDTLIISETSDLNYYLGLHIDTNLLFAASLSDLDKEPIYGEDALQVCTNGVSSSLFFDKEGKYYLDIITDFTTHIEVKSCKNNKTIYSLNVYMLSDCFFDEQDNLYIVHEGYVDRVNLLTKERKTIIDLSTIAQRKNENRVGEDYVFVRSCLINNSRYLAGIVFEPSHNYNRIYILDMDTEEIVAMSNSLGILAENGYAQIAELYGVLYATIIGVNGNSAVCYSLAFDNEQNLIFSAN